MSKSILIMETPGSCSKCPLFFGAYTDMVCKANNRTINYPYPNDRVQDWCPIKEVPEKRKPRKILDEHLCSFRMSGFDKGYNKCIDDILAEDN